MRIVVIWFKNFEYSDIFIIFVANEVDIKPMMLRTIFYSLPPGLRLTMRRLYFLPADIFRGISGKRHKYEPPKGKIFIGSGDFIKHGQHHLQLLIHHAALQPDDHVLDVGCGMGRTAAALTTFISERGRYEGFDIMKQGINWCNRKIARDFYNFRFTHVPLGNDLYNNNKNFGEQFRFPFNDNSFDVCFLFSVFSHMLPDETSNYLSEIQRTLKPGGKCLTTFFIFDQPDDFKHKHPKDRFKFPVDMGHYRLMNEKVKSANVAYQKYSLLEMIIKAGLKTELIIDGYWKGDKAQYNDFQDILVLKKV